MSDSDKSVYDIEYIDEDYDALPAAGLLEDRLTVAAFAINLRLFFLFIVAMIISGLAVHTAIILFIPQRSESPVDVYPRFLIDNGGSALVLMCFALLVLSIILYQLLLKRFQFKAIRKRLHTAIQLASGGGSYER
jgi:hypothetical protein